MSCWLIVFLLEIILEIIDPQCNAIRVLLGFVDDDSEFISLQKFNIVVEPNELPQEFFVLLIAGNGGNLVNIDNIFIDSDQRSNTLQERQCDRVFVKDQVAPIVIGLLLDRIPINNLGTDKFPQNLQTFATIVLLHFLGNLFVQKTLNSFVTHNFPPCELTHFLGWIKRIDVKSINYFHLNILYYFIWIMSSIRHI